MSETGRIHRVRDCIIGGKKVRLINRIQYEPGARFAAHPVGWPWEIWIEGARVEYGWASTERGASDQIEERVQALRKMDRKRNAS